jgi:hypothetical protein
MMNEDAKNLVSEGYCFSIKNSGPFVIGEDFEAPGPAARIVPRVKIDREKRDELWSFVERGGESKADDGSDEAIFRDVTKRLDFENGVNQALNWYVSDSEFQAKVVRFSRRAPKAMENGRTV